MFETIIRFFQEGGAFMFPIAIVLMLGLIIAVERFFFLFAAARSNSKTFSQLLPLIKKRELKQAFNDAKASNNPMGMMMSEAVRGMAEQRTRDELQYRLDENVMELIPRFEKRTQYLATLANVATLLGLLGTIIGLIAAFTAVASADPSQKASLLSQSISVAMNTTAFGLMAAIPLLLIHSMLQAKINDLSDTFEMASIKVLNLVAEPIVKAAPVAAPSATK